jgi:CheY-like chemotaxis protein
MISYCRTWFTDNRELTCKPSLLLDDEELVLDLVCIVLQSAGYDVLRAASGPRALALCQGSHSISFVGRDDARHGGPGASRVPARVAALCSYSVHVRVHSFSDWRTGNQGRGRRLYRQAIFNSGPGSSYTRATVGNASAAWVGKRAARLPAFSNPRRSNNSGSCRSSSANTLPDIRDAPAKSHKLYRWSW